MLTQISDNELNKLPLHDEEIHSLNTTYADDGKISLSIRIKINQEEVDTLLNEFGIKESIIELTFIDCWKIISDYNKTCNNEITLEQGKLGGCGEWAYAQYEALNGAGIESDIVYAVPFAGVPIAENIYNHATATYQDNDGKWYAMDIWQHGKDNKGKIANFETSKYNGNMLLEEWISLQKSKGKLNISCDNKSVDLSKYYTIKQQEYKIIQSNKFH